MDETARQTSTGRRIVGVLASGLGRRSTSHYSPTDSPNSPSLLAKRQFAFPILAVLAVAALGLWLLLPGGALRAQDAAIEYAENGKDPVATFTATDPEGATPITWSVLPANDLGNIDGVDEDDAADAAHFTIDKDGMLKFAIGSDDDPPDFEAPRGADVAVDANLNNLNTYHVVVVACDVPLVSNACPDTGKAGYHKVTVKVTNVAETGKVTWTVDANGDANGGDTHLATAPKLTQFQVGASLEVSADSGVTDGDVAGTDKDVTERLQWSRSSSKTGTWTPIKDATDASYTVTTEDIGMYLRVEAFYNVGTGREESASLTSDYRVLASRSSNEEPEFSPAAVTREVSEGKKGMAVGAPVRATDDITNALNYVLTGTDSDRFEIDQKTGQIKTLVGLDHEGGSNGAIVATADALGFCAGANGTPGPECTVTVTATDSSGEDSDPPATVTIKITNVDEKPTFSSTSDAIGMAKITRDEGMTALADDAAVANVTYSATDPDGLQVSLTLMGVDGAKFEISSAGVLSFKTKPDYEKPTDRNKDNVYEVTVRASDGTMHADRTVTVTVTDADEAPTVMGKDSVNYVENGKDPVATFTATDPEGATSITWLLATNDDIDGVVAADVIDNDDFAISKEGELTFAVGTDDTSPDFENPLGGTSTDSNTYSVVVLAADAAEGVTGRMTGYHKVTVKVTNVAETGKVTWTVDAGDVTLVQFQVGASLVASVSDGDISGEAKAVVDANNNLTWRWYRGGTVISDETDATYDVTTEDVSKRLRVVASYTVGDEREESASLTSDYPVLASRTSNDAPEFSPAAVTRNVSEGKKGMTVGAPVRATDDISNALNYTLGTDGDNDKFKIDQKTGQITTNVELDYNSTAGEADNCIALNSCVVEVTATDSAGKDSDSAATVTIKITNVDEKPTFDTGSKMVDVAEGTTVADVNLDGDGEPTTPIDDSEAVYSATDPDGLRVNLSLMGADGAKFELSTDGVLSFMTKPDYEMPADANKDNVYEVTVRASDGTLSEDRMVKVTVTNEDEAPEIIAGGLAISGQSSVSYAENGTDLVVATYTLAGPESDSGRWTTLGGDDAGDFRISNSGVLSFRSSPNYEAPADEDMDNVYMVTLNARDREPNTATRNVVVTVTDVDEGTTTPVIGGTLLDRSDTNTNGQIEKSEVIRAFQEYVSSSGQIDKSEIIEVFQKYIRDSANS